MAAPALTAQFTLGPEITPSWDPAWQVAPGWVQARYFEAALAVVLSEKDAELAAGLGVSGSPLAPLRPSTLKHRRSAMGPVMPGAPPLMPALAASRTRAWLQGRVMGNASEGYYLLFGWKGGWGQILLYHQAGSARLPQRDVIGLSPATLARVKARSLAWWLANKAVLMSGIYVPKSPEAAVAKNPIEVRNLVIGEKTYTFGVSSGTTGGAEYSAIEAYREALAAGRTSGRGFRRHAIR